MAMNEKNLADAKTMRKSWEARAGSDPLYAIDARRRNWEVRDFYSQGAQLVEEIVDPALKVLSVDPSELRVLEIGCGMGRLFEGLSHRFAEVWGIDISQGMIEQGRAQCPVEAKWILGDGVSLNGVDSESIDYTLSYQVFIHPRQPSIVHGYLKFKEFLDLVELFRCICEEEVIHSGKRSCAECPDHSESPRG